MGLSPCRVCKKDVSDDAKQCPHCGAEEPSNSLQAVGRRWFNVLVVVVLLGLAFLFLREMLSSTPLTKAAVDKIQKGMKLDEVNSLLGGPGVVIKPENESRLSFREKAIATVLQTAVDKLYSGPTAELATLRVWRGEAKDKPDEFPVVGVATFNNEVIHVVHSDGPW